MSEADISRVIGVFEASDARWTLVGAHAIGLLTEPRATVDFDFIVEGRKIKIVLDGLTEEFGDLGTQDMGAALRLCNIDVDLIRSTNHPLFRHALEQSRSFGDWKTPRPEVIIALKFLSALSPWRNRDKRAQDMVDLSSVYNALGPDGLDRDYMVELSTLVYPGAEREFESLLDQIDRGDPIKI